MRLRVALPASPAARLTLAATLSWLGLFWAYGIARHAAFITARLDLGDMTQALWNTAHGRFLEATLFNGENVSRLGGHVDPLLAAFTPLWWLWPSPLLLISISAIVSASGVLPVYRLAGKHLGSDRAAAEFSLVYLLCPLTQWNAIWDFHPVSLAIPLILWAVWFLDEDRLFAFAAVALLAAASKEEIPLAVGFLGLWYARAHGRKLVGATIFLLGMTLTLVDFLIVIPHFSAAGAEPFAGRYIDVGGTPHGIIRTALSDPGRIISVAFSAHNVGYLVALAVLFGGLCFGSPLLALGALPDLVINILSNNPNQTSLQFQYTAGIFPFFLAASIFTARKLQPRVPSVAQIAVGFALLGCILFGPLRFAGPVVRGALPGNAERKAAVAAVSRIPADAAVSASNRLGGHLSARRYIYVFPKLRNATWAAFDVNDKTSVGVPGFAARIRRLRYSPQWTLVYDRSGVLVFRKR
jgi:uncharacterized membrane protein